MDRDGNPRGWGFYLSQVFRDGCDYFNFSRPGAKSAEVRDHQLKKALALQPEICAVIVGGNDMLRNGFDPKDLYANLHDITATLLKQGSHVLMIELHDPGQILRVPKLLKRVIRRRVNAVNSVYHRISREFDIQLIATRKIPHVHDLQNWHIDRMHPGPHGHKLLAQEMARGLRAQGFDIEIPSDPVDDPYSRSEKIWWLLCKGTPWFLKRSVDLLPVAIFLMALESLRIAVEGLRSLVISGKKWSGRSITHTHPNKLRKSLPVNTRQ
jgi:hypothetical protein